MTRSILYSLVAALVLGQGIAAAPLAAPTVKTSDGTTYTGKTTTTVESFLGIPFAQPPIGNLRFAPPVARTGSLGQFDATSYGASCPQVNIASGILPGLLGEVTKDVLDLVVSLPLFSSVGFSDTSEDCLTINVQRPVGVSATAKLPVLFWIYGGAFVLGTSATYDGSALVERSVALGTPVIFISVNYRTNAFGFLPGVEVANDATASVNAGLQDQRLGLEWVQKYASSFGGDPSKVTIFGESAGAISVAFQLQAFDGDITSTVSGKPLFRAAIMQSGSAIPVLDETAGQSSFDAIANRVGCKTVANPIACLRAVPFAKLQDAINTIPSIFSIRSVSLPFLPRTDGVFLRDRTQNNILAGKYAKVPIISGDQYDEGTILALGTLNVTTESQLDNWLRDVWFPRTTSAQRKKILDLYPADVTKGSPFDTGIFNVLTPQNKRINAIVGDVVFQVARRVFVTAAYQTQPTWSYVSRVFQGVPLLGSFHASDVLSVFGLSPLNPATEMQSRWIAFANTLNPNVKGYPYWPTYQSNSTLLQFSDVTSSKIVKDDFRSAAIAYWWTIVDYLSL